MTRGKLAVVLAVGLAVAGTGVTAAGQQRPYRQSDQQLKALVNRIDSHTDAFRDSLDRAFDGSGIEYDRQARNAIHQAVDDFRQTTDRLRDRINDRRSTALDAEEVLRRGAGLDGFRQRDRWGGQAEQNWLALRGDLDELARAYNVAWDWSQRGYMPVEPGAGFLHRLTGTYQLENDRGDDPQRAAELAARVVPAAQRERTYQNLLSRLEAPDLMAIERHANSVTMASTRGPRTTVEADGRMHREQWSAGRTMNTRATLTGERLVVATTGNRGSDFTVTFDPMENGRRLRMTRTIDDERLRGPVTVRSSYRRLSNEARWNIDTSERSDLYDDTGSRGGDLAVPDGTRFVALLDNALNTASAREGDAYTLTTRSPSQYEGAVIQGFVSEVNESGRLSGRAGMTLNLQSIRLRDGRSVPFDGVIEDVRTPDGKEVRLDREGSVDSQDGQTRKTVERGVIGAALGAIIGAVTGGGKGAAIGAVIGGGAGAGTVMIEGRDRLDLQRGTEVTITAGDPMRQRTVPAVQR